MDEQIRKLELAPALKEIREQTRTNNDNRLVGLINDWNGIRLFLLGGFHHDGVWPAGTISLRVDGDEIVCTLSIHALEIEAKFRGNDWDEIWLEIDNQLSRNVVCWQMDWKGRERLERKLTMS